jgi:hypothetical protein
MTSKWFFIVGTILLLVLPDVIVASCTLIYGVVVFAKLVRRGHEQA